MNIALVIAGGSGKRMGQDVPKQFITVFEKPILIYTLENFQRHEQIDAIAVVCIAGWEDRLRAYAAEYGIDKLKWIFHGGETGQESIRNGVMALNEICSEEDIVVVHDGIRPMMDPDVLTNVLETCKRHGNAVSSLPYNEQIFLTEDGLTASQYIPRDMIRRVSTPQAYRYGKLNWAYREAFARNIGIGPSTYTNTLMTELGERLYFADGSEKNIKLTTQEDLEIFEALLRLDRQKR